MSEEDQKKVSYRYWVKKDDNFFGGLEVDCKPQKIESFENTQKTFGNSAWNAAGTWEEKKINLSLLQNYLNENSFFKNFQMEPEKYESLTGKGNVVYINGKIKPGYHIDITIQYAENGELQITEFQDDGDFQFKIIDDDKPRKESVSKLINEIIQNLQINIKQFANIL